MSAVWQKTNKLNEYPVEAHYQISSGSHQVVECMHPPEAQS